VDILANVIRKYFIGGIQPRAAALNRRYEDLLPPIAVLEQVLGSALPPAYQAWRDQRDADLARWLVAPRQHVAELQAIQRPCRANPEDSWQPARTTGYNDAGTNRSG